MRRRLEPFLDLLDARYLPLLFAAAPQAWTVYAWLLASGTPEQIARMGGIGFEFIYVGSIAWAVRGAGWQAARLPAVTALVFSCAVAVAHYAVSQGYLAVLHVGWPLVAYAYTVMIHAPKRTTTARPIGAHRTLVRSLVAEVRRLRASPRIVSAHACARCGAPVESQPKAAASARWGCARCKGRIAA